MQYLVIFTPKHAGSADGPPADFEEQEAKEQRRAKELYKEGGARQLWALDTKDKGAAVLFEALSPEHLQEMINSFPLIQKDYAGYNIHPLAPYPAFGKTD